MTRTEAVKAMLRIDRRTTRWQSPSKGRSHHLSDTDSLSDSRLSEMSKTRKLLMVLISVNWAFILFINILEILRFTAQVYGREHHNEQPRSKLIRRDLP